MKKRIKRTLKRETPRWIVLLIDMYITFCTFIISYLLISTTIDFRLSIFKEAVVASPLVLFISLLSFLFIGSFRGVVRHTGFKDAINVLKSTILICLILIAVSYLVDTNFINDHSLITVRVVIMHFLLNTITLVSLRILYKSLYNNYVLNTKFTSRAMIYGAGDSGILTYQAIKNDERNRIHVFGYMDDKKSKAGKKINGVMVYRAKKVDLDFIKANHINEIIISIQNIRPSRLREIVDSFNDTPVKLKIVPAVSNWINGDLRPQQIKPIKIEDLLGRKSIKLNNNNVANQIDGKTVLVTGAAGSIGSEIARQLLSQTYKKLILVDQAESCLYDLQQTIKHKIQNPCEFVIGDIRDPDRVETIFRVFKPDIVFHAAAYKHVPLMENNPYEAVATNIKGTKIVADMAVQYNVEKFIMISTDKAVNPTNVMGATKRIAELYVTQLNSKTNTNFIVTRFGNVLGSNGSVIPLFKRQIEEGGPLTITHKDITRYFMTIPEACQLVLEAGAMGKGGEVFVFDMGESVKIMDLAKKMIRLSGLRYPEDIDIKITGLRPGEKIYEELLADDENTEKTHHEKIMIAKVKNNKEPDFVQKIEKLIEKNTNPNQIERNNQLVLKIKELVPEYISQNSVYTSIDEQSKIKLN